MPAAGRMPRTPGSQFRSTTLSPKPTSRATESPKEKKVGYQQSVPLWAQLSGRQGPNQIPVSRPHPQTVSYEPVHVMQPGHVESAQMSYPGPPPHTSPTMPAQGSPRLRHRAQAQGQAQSQVQRSTRSAQAPAGHSPGERVPSFSPNPAHSAMNMIGVTQYGVPQAVPAMHTAAEEAAKGQGPMPFFWSGAPPANEGGKRSPSRQSGMHQSPVHRHSGTPSMAQHRTSGAMCGQVTSVSPRARVHEKRNAHEYKASPRGPHHDVPARCDADKENMANMWPDVGARYGDNVLKPRAEAQSHRSKHTDEIYCDNGVELVRNQQCEAEYRASFLKYEREVAHMAEELKMKQMQLEKQRSEIDIHERARLDQLDKYKCQLANLDQDVKNRKEELRACKQALHDKDEELLNLKEEVRRKGLELTKKEGLEAQREHQRQAQREVQNETQLEAQRAKDELRKVSATLAETVAKYNAVTQESKQEYHLLHDRFLKLKQEKERLEINTTPGEFLKMVRSKQSEVQVWQQLAHLRERIADLEWESEVQRRHLTPAALEAVAREMGQPAQEPSP